MIGNRVTEKDVRDWLDGQGYFGNSAKFIELELHAIQRPGWIQVFRFHVEAKSASEGWVELFGAVRDDERERTLEKRTRIFAFPEITDRDQLLTELSEGCITGRRPHESGDLKWTLFIFGALVFIVLVLLTLWMK